MENLEVQKTELEDKVKRLQADLRKPLDIDSDEQALEISNQIILRRLLEIERSNLRRVNLELEKQRKQTGEI